MNDSLIKIFVLYYRLLKKVVWNLNFRIPNLSTMLILLKAELPQTIIDPFKVLSNMFHAWMLLWIDSNRNSISSYSVGIPLTTKTKYESKLLGPYLDNIQLGPRERDKPIHLSQKAPHASSHRSHSPILVSCQPCLTQGLYPWKNILPLWESHILLMGIHLYEP